MKRFDVTNYVNKLNIIAVLVNRKTNEMITKVKKNDFEKDGSVNFQIYLHTFSLEKEFIIDLELMKTEKDILMKTKIKTYHWKNGKGFFSREENEKHKIVESNIGVLKGCFSVLELKLNTKLEDGCYDMSVFVRESTQEETDKKIITSCPFLVEG